MDKNQKTMIDLFSGAGAIIFGAGVNNKDLSNVNLRKYYVYIIVVAMNSPALSPVQKK